MHTILILEFFNPQNIIQYGGVALLLFIVFAETGLFFGFFFLAILFCLSRDY